MLLLLEALPRALFSTGPFLLPYTLLAVYGVSKSIVFKFRFLELMLTILYCTVRWTHWFERFSIKNTATLRVVGTWMGDRLETKIFFT
jgi:hypothetical protein